MVSRARSTDVRQRKSGSKGVYVSFAATGQPVLVRAAFSNKQPDCSTPLPATSVAARRRNRRIERAELVAAKVYLRRTRRTASLVRESARRWTIRRRQCDVMPE